MKKIYSVYDSKVGAYMQPFYCQTKGEAIRGFSDEVSNEQSMLNKHAEDFTLFEIGEFNESTGEIKSYETKISCGVAWEFKKIETKNNIGIIK